MQNKQLMSIIYIIFLLLLLPIILYAEDADNFFEIESIHFYKKAKKDDVEQFYNAGTSIRSLKKYPPYMKIDVKVKEQQSSKDIFAKVYFYNVQKELLAKSISPISTKRLGGYNAFPTIFRKQKAEPLYFILPENLQKEKFGFALFVFGDKQSAVAKVYPKGNVADFEFFEKALVLNDNKVKRDIFTDPIIEHQVNTGNPKQPVITFFMRIPLGITNFSEAKGVLAMSLLANSIDGMRRQLQDVKSKNEVGGLLRFAQEKKLVIICWDSRSLWNPRKNWDEQKKSTNKDFDRLFDEISEDWEKGIKYFIRRYNIPRNGYLLWGASGAAQYAARLVMRKPEYFSAIHIHIPSSFDVPTKKANKIFWCLTTGENEVGYGRSLRFLTACKELGYPIIYKAIPGLAHQGHPQANLLGYRFFEYVIELQEQTKVSNYRGEALPQKKAVAEFRTLDNPLYVGDILNQQVSTPEEAILIQKKYQVPLPTKKIAEAWKEK